MAQKAQAQHIAADDVRTEDMDFEIEGLEQVGDGIFRMRGVPVMNIDWPAIGKVLTDSGVTRMDADRYVDELVGTVSTDQLAKLFAQRSKRIG
jgi:hypothetical protein